MFYQILPKNWTFIENWKTPLPRLQNIPYLVEKEEEVGMYAAREAID